MTLCPIALAVGCKKCPAFSACPLKSVIGDQQFASLTGAAAYIDEHIGAKRDLLDSIGDGEEGAYFGVPQIDIGDGRVGPTSGEGNSSVFRFPLKDE